MFRWHTGRDRLPLSSSLQDGEDGGSDSVLSYCQTPGGWGPALSGHNRPQDSSTTSQVTLNTCKFSIFFFKFYLVRKRMIHDCRMWILDSPWPNIALLYVCTLKPPFCICPLFVSAFPVSISSRSLYLPPLTTSVEDPDPLETYPNPGDQKWPTK